jgi:hypothetical protein
MMPRFFNVLNLFPLALAAAACSDPPPTPAAAGFKLSLGPASASDLPAGSSPRSCTVPNGAHSFSLGAPIPGKTLEDGKNNVSVKCRVAKDGTFAAIAGGKDPDLHEDISINVSGRIIDTTKNSPTNMGSLVFFSPETFTLQTDASQNTPSCTFGPVDTLKPGAILTDIHCPIIVAGDGSPYGCSVNGTIAFEYCETGEEQN